MPPSDDQLRAIGRISVAINELDVLMNVFAWALINPDDLEIGRLALEKDQFSRVLEKLRRLAEHVLSDDPGLLTRVKQWADHAGQVQRRRSEVLHALWVLDQPTGTMVGWLNRKEIQEIDASVGRLNGLADDITSVRQELMQIINDTPEFPQQPWFPK